MSTESWHDIMTLLSLVVLADKRVYKEEVDTFVSAAVKLNGQVNPGLFITEKMALSWFIENRDGLKSALQSPSINIQIDRILGTLKPLKNKQAILTVMKAIAQADSDYHKSEHYMVKRAATLWGMPVP